MTMNLTYYLGHPPSVHTYAWLYERAQGRPLEATLCKTEMHPTCLARPLRGHRSRYDQPCDLLLPVCLPFARVDAADQRQKINSSTLRSLGPVDSLDLFYMYKNSARGHIPDLVTMLWP